ncbi:thioredoxin family protein [candidate division CSSED10-310 bacterium]|uniref:Thioredoxin family protein n=1 Tax=candidate division CSSED10-310 bacterium TaxID=2855610 RepID=A0ABV6YWR1_UNCC1
MKIEVLGPGCAKCRKLYEVTQQAVAEAGLEAEIEKVEDISKISSYGVFLTPALVVDGVVKSSGKVLKVKDVLKALQQ